MRYLNIFFRRLIVEAGLARLFRSVDVKFGDKGQGRSAANCWQSDWQLFRRGRQLIAAKLRLTFAHSQVDLITTVEIWYYSSGNFLFSINFDQWGGESVEIS